MLQFNQDKATIKLKLSTKSTFPLDSSTLITLAKECNVIVLFSTINANTIEIFFEVFGNNILTVTNYITSQLIKKIENYASLIFSKIKQECNYEFYINAQQEVKVSDGKGFHESISMISIMPNGNKGCFNVIS